MKWLEAELYEMVWMDVDIDLEELGCNTGFITKLMSSHDEIRKLGSASDHIAEIFFKVFHNDLPVNSTQFECMIKCFNVD